MGLIETIRSSFAFPDFESTPTDVLGYTGSCHKTFPLNLYFTRPIKTLNENLSCNDQDKFSPRSFNP
jgi:hypothetical protein